MPEYWASCGYRLLATTPGGQLALSDAFLASYLLRSELAPQGDSCAAELALHERLLARPRSEVAEAEIASIADPDVRDNYRIWLRFRQRLLAAPTLEAAYTALFAGGGVDVPPLFVHQLTQILLRHILGEAADPFEARAAEMLFRPQRVRVLPDQRVMAADLETVDRHATTGGFGNLGELLLQNRTPARTIDLDVLSDESAAAYWGRDESHDFALSLNQGGRALTALCRVLERWVAHFLAVQVTIRPQGEIDEAHWLWHVGLDAEASALLNDLYNRAEVEPERLRRLLCLFELSFAHGADMRAELQGFPVYLAMAVDADDRLRLKPQNLLLNLPLARPQ